MHPHIDSRQGHQQGEGDRWHRPSGIRQRDQGRQPRAIGGVRRGERGGRSASTRGTHLGQRLTRPGPLHDRLDDMTGELVGQEEVQEQGRHQKTAPCPPLPKEPRQKEPPRKEVVLLIGDETEEGVEPHRGPPPIDGVDPPQVELGQGFQHLSPRRSMARAPNPFCPIVPRQVHPRGDFLKGSPSQAAVTSPIPKARPRRSRAFGEGPGPPRTP